MILPGAIGGSGAVRPFFNRAPAGGPVETIVRTALGTAFDFDPGGVASLVLGPVAVGASETLIVLSCHDDPTGGDVDSYGVTLDGASAAFDAIGTNGSVFGQVGVIWSLPGNGTARAGNVVLDYSGATAQPLSAAIICLKVTGLVQVGGLDKSANASGLSANPDSGVTAATALAHEFVIGNIFTDGTPADALGAWQAGLAAGQRVGTAGGGFAPLDLKEGWNVIHAAAGQRAQILGAAVRSWGAIVATYKGV